jgi:hypothetical protein
MSSTLDKINRFRLKKRANRNRARELKPYDQISSIGLVYALTIQNEKLISGLRHELEMEGKEVFTMGVTGEKGWMERIIPTHKAHYLDRSCLDFFRLPKPATLSGFCGLQLDCLINLDQNGDLLTYAVCASSNAYFRFAPYDEENLPFVDAMIKTEGQSGMSGFLEEVLKQLRNR